MVIENEHPLEPALYGNFPRTTGVPFAAKTIGCMPRLLKVPTAVKLIPFIVGVDMV